MQSLEPWLAPLGMLSIILLGATVFAVPWLIARLPTDYFRRAESPSRYRGFLRIAVLVGRNLVGILFLLLGIIMLVTPGPGVIAILLGLSLSEFPGRRHLIRRLAMQPSVYRSLNWLRQRQRQPPFDAP